MKIGFDGGYSAVEMNTYSQPARLSIKPLKLARRIAFGQASPALKITTARRSL